MFVRSKNSFVFFPVKTKDSSAMSVVRKSFFRNPSKFTIESTFVLLMIIEKVSCPFKQLFIFLHCLKWLRKLVAWEICMKICTQRKIISYWYVRTWKVQKCKTEFTVSPLQVIQSFRHLPNRMLSYLYQFWLRSP